MSDTEMHEKLSALKANLRDLGRVAVAFSGGVDSTLLAKVAHDALGDDMIAITAHIHSTPQRDTDEATAFCEAEGIRHIVLELDELQIPGFVQNPPNRCYLCKTALFSRMLEECVEQGGYVLCEGSNLDDEGDYRPGLVALAELKINSPLRAANLRKSEIRGLARELGLKVWDKPSAACLSSRYAYGQTITAEGLARIDKAESYMRELGFAQVRVRVQGDAARIEVERERLAFACEPDVRDAIAKRLHELGFLYVSLDLDGFRSGSMNAVLGK